MLFAVVFAPVTSHAGGVVLAPIGMPLPNPGIGVRMAIAIGPSSTTRWSEVTVPAGPAVGWLVPIRPGASIEMVSNEWLSSLDTATAPRVLVPKVAAPCALHQSFESPSPWVRPGASLAPSPIALPVTAADAQAWAEGHGLSVGGVGPALVDLYASGWRVAAIELAASDSTRTSPTLRVTDDGGAILPLSITASDFDTKVTLFVVGAGHATTADTREMNDSALEWSVTGSSYTNLRRNLLGGGGWLRESSSHDALFDSVPITLGQSVPPVTATYCSALPDIGSSTDVQSAETLTCDTHTDLAFALAGIAPADAVLTRLAGLLPTGQAAGAPAITLGTGPARSPVRTAASYDHPCPVDVDPGGDDDDTTSPSPSSPSGSSPSFPRYPGGSSSSSSNNSNAGAGSSTPEVYVPSDGCSGGGGTYVEEDDSEAYSSSDSSDSCSSDTSSSNSGDGWDSSDSSDGCSSDTSSSGDGWDSSDSSCSTVRRSKRRGPSPLSRVVLLAAACLIPLRRLTRKRKEG